MEFNEQNFNDLLSDDDIVVDEDVVEEEVKEDDPLDLGEYISNNNTKEESEPSEELTEETPEEHDDFISSYLKSYGIEDASKIQMQDESGEIKEVDFNTLSEEEKFNIFKELSDPGYTDYEKDVINYLRTNNVTLNDVIDYYSKKAVEDYLNENPEKAHQRYHSIDEYTDDEVYLADLKNKYPDFTDEELVSKLESAKTNEDLFAKEVSAIRASQIAYEEEQLKLQQAQEEQSYQELQNNLQAALSNFTQIDLDPEDTDKDALALDITDADRDIMLRYLIERDKDGKSQLVRDLEDPNALIELAYYRTRERDNLTGLTRYWKNELANERKEKAKLQKELDRLKNKGKNSFVVQPENPSPKTRKLMDIYG